MSSNELNDRILERVKSRIAVSNLEMEEKQMLSRRKRIISFMSVICVISVGFAFANHFRGFSDVYKGTSVVGTTYEEATEMIKIDVEAGDNLLVTANVVDYTNIPYSEIEKMDINSYKIMDSVGKIVKDGNAKSITEFENGVVSFEISLGNVDSGEYKIVIDEFVGTKKADQPLPIKGVWECSFVR